MTDHPGSGALAGKPNGRTERFRKLKEMSPDERKAHRRHWREAQKLASKQAVPAAVTTAAPPQQYKKRK